MKISLDHSVNFNNLTEKEVNKSSDSNFDLTKVNFPFRGYNELYEKYFTINNFYGLHKQKFNEKIIKDRKSDSLNTINQKEKLGNIYKESKNIDIKIVNENEKTGNSTNYSIKENDDKSELNEKRHEKKMEEIRLMHVKMLEEINNNMLKMKRKSTNESVNDKPNHDKIMKKIRIMILNSIIIFINKMIKIIYNNNIMKVF